jgi:hypothetical protein
MAVSVAIAENRGRRRRASSRALRVVGVVAAITAAFYLVVHRTMIRMPGVSYAGPFEPLSEHERALERDLRRDVEALVALGDRGVSAPQNLAAAADLFDRAFTEAGYAARRQRYDVGGVGCDNVEAELPGVDRAGEIVIVGAHYDSVHGTVGADDNGSGAAALLATARAFAHRHPSRTLRFVAFAGEEPPHFQTAAMGSRVYARRSRERGEKVVAMLSLETIGFYSDRPGSQRYPFPFGLVYPTTGDFIAFVGDTGSGDLVRQAVAAFRSSTRFPSEGVAAPSGVPGIGWSDHWSFWQEGYPAAMVTDTAPFRNPHYHTLGDTPETLSYAPMARVVAGIERVIEAIADAPPR